METDWISKIDCLHCGGKETITIVHCGDKPHCNCESPWLGKACTVCGHTNGY